MLITSADRRFPLKLEGLYLYSIMSRVNYSTLVIHIWRNLIPEGKHEGLTCPKCLITVVVAGVVIPGPCESTQFRKLQNDLRMTFFF